MRKSKLKPIIITILILAVIVCAGLAVLYYSQQTKDTYEKQINDLEYEIESKYQTVYVASKDLSRGEVLEEGVNVELQTIVSGLEFGMYIDYEDLGKSCLVDIPMYTPILKNMLSVREIAQDTREVEINTVSLMTDQNEYDVIDIRIMFPNGEDYLVLSKKEVRNLSLINNTFFTYLNEEEILRFSCALVDSYLTTGTKLYAVRYVEPNLQDAGIPNYPLKAEIIDLINNDPNILTKATETMSLNARIDLENRLGGLTEDQLEAVAAGNDVVDTAKTSVLSESQVDDQYIQEE